MKLKPLLSTIKQYKLSALLNITGLSIAFTVSYIFLPRVYNDLTFNRGIKDCERIFRIETRLFNIEEKWEAHLPSDVFYNFLETSPIVESFYCNSLMIEDIYSPDADPNSDKAYKLSTRNSDHGIKETLSLKIIEGDFDAVSNKSAANISISRSSAKKMNVGVGSTIYLHSNNKETGIPYNIVSIHDDMPKNSDFRLDAILNFTRPNQRTIIYVKLYDKSDEKALICTMIKHLNTLQNHKNYDRFKNLTEENVENHIRLTPITESQFTHDIEVWSGYEIDRNSFYTAILVTVLILSIAFINYYNFFVALIPRRVRNANIKKVLGVSTCMQRAEIIAESIAIVGISLILAFCFIAAMEHEGCEISQGVIAENTHILFAITLFALSAAICTAIYPAFYITSFTPSAVLKGRFGKAKEGMALRNILLSIQFMTSFIFIVVTFAIYNQYYTSVKRDCGFKKDNLYLFNFGHRARITEENAENIRVAALQHPNIENIAFADKLFSTIDYYGRNIKIQSSEKEICIWGLYIDEKFLDLMNIEMVEGENFSINNRKGRHVMVNEQTAKDYEIRPGELLIESNGRSYEVAGVCKDFDVHAPIFGNRPFWLIYSAPGDCPSTMYIRAKEEHNRDSIASYIQELYAKYQTDTEYTPKLESIDEVITEDNSYTLDTVKDMGKYALLAIFVSLLGLFGLVFFETEYRRREIAIRRVNGAQRSDIIALFYKRYITILAICFILAQPIAMYIVDLILQGYTHRAPVSAPVYVLSFMSVLLLTIAVVTASAWKVINMNPTTVLDKE